MNRSAPFWIFPRPRATSLDVAAGPLVILAKVERQLHRLTEALGPTGPPWGIGIGLPGPVEFGSGDPVSPPIMPGWDRYPVRERFTSSAMVLDQLFSPRTLGAWLDAGRPEAAAVHAVHADHADQA